jgi:16S rRNA (uracil1498-N3)-methyltransferase
MKVGTQRNNISGVGKQQKSQSEKEAGVSFVPRLFLPGLSGIRDSITLDESASRYLTKVLRLKAGDLLRGFDAKGFEYELCLQTADERQAQALVKSRREKKENGDTVHITLGQSLPKAAKMDLILRQGTEAGVNRFIPLLSRRSISRPDEERRDHKKERWQKIIVEASRQCGRPDIPRLDPVALWSETLAKFSDFDLVLMPYEKEAPTLQTVLKSKCGARNILILIGPEGGWAPEEVEEASLNGAFSVHLPTPILRTETAGIAVVSMLKFFFADRDDSK